MPSFREGLLSGLKSAYCQQVANSPQWFGNLRAVLVSGDLIQRGDNLYRWVCDVPPDEPPGIDYPSVGGQCSGRAYYCDYDSPQLEAFPGCGITYTRVRAAAICYGPCSTSQAIVSTVARCPGVSRYVLTVRNGDGSLAFDTGTGSNGDVGYRNIVFTPVDGLPDGCGNEQPDVPPPAPIETDVDITYNDGDDTEYNLTVPTIFAPFYVSLNGELTVPVQIGDFNFNGELTFEPNFEFAPDFGTGDGGGPTPDHPALPSPGNPGDSEEPEENGPESTIIGVHVRISVDGPTNATSILQTGAPNIIAPRAANVAFAVRTGTLTGWLSDIPVKSVQAYIPCPTTFGAIDVRVTPEPGFTVEFSPVRARPLAPYQP